MTSLGGTDAYLKIAPASLGPEALAAARRELRFYRDLASIVPVRAPRLINHLDVADGVALLLADAGGSLAVDMWRERDWAALGHDLAALHSASGLPTRAWDGPDALGAAMTDPDIRTMREFWESALPQFDHILSGADRVRGDMSAVPPTFVHGDCHTENVTFDHGSLVLCDWQSSGVGRPSGDLALLSVRATPAGVAVPRALFDAYLKVNTERSAELRRATLAEELAILLFQWPHYAMYNSPAGNDRIRRRGTDLAARWTGESDSGGRST
ncbi:Phosphotransferase enzyme family protein [Micromonospora pallida]|uniref:Phosphotransferase enzyme family protein n=1 Tax=Micromonospora pallida TaxID=145854 RepID=A0A1C6RV68_9ACTN|nr:aminoglycoside phosphotransferase family protein [Micromonospora pallida]SCL21093.1 Phosphotransferase enzyme family protein [Micromonospora pallida]